MSGRFSQRLIVAVARKIIIPQGFLLFTKTIYPTPLLLGQSGLAGRSSGQGLRIRGGFNAPFLPYPTERWGPQWSIGLRPVLPSLWYTLPSCAQDLPLYVPLKPMDTINV